MALSLLALYKEKQFGWVKVEDFLLKHGYQRCGDFTYLVHFGLLEKMQGEREDGSNRNGFYKITGRGIMFCEQKLTVNSKFYMFNGKLDGFDGEQIGIQRALGKKFSYTELMQEHLLNSIIPSGEKTSTTERFEPNY